MSNPTESRKRTVQQGRDLIAAWKASGISATAFCREQGIHPKRIDWWKRRLRQLDEAQPRHPSAMSFIEIPTNQEKPPPAPSKAPSTMDILLPCGIRLTLHPDTPLERLSAVVAALSPKGSAPC